MRKSRRVFLGTGLAAAAAACAPKGAAHQANDTFVDIMRPPDFVRAHVEGSARVEMLKSSHGWQAEDVEITITQNQQGERKTLAISVAAPRSPIERLQLRWLGRLPQTSRFLGDHWERGYGDLEWRGFVADRAMPWYFLVATEEGTYGYGVKTGANAFCFWEADAQGISLWLDVRNGGSGVQLGQRHLLAAEVVALRGNRDVTPYRAACALCRALADHPRLPEKPVYGSNNWYYLYGENMTAESVLRDVDQLAELSPLALNPPYMVLDAGWGKTEGGAGPWTEDNLRFPQVPALPSHMKKRGVRPGIWIRPLFSSDVRTKAWTLARAEAPSFTLDPSISEALAYVQDGLRRVTGWGYELVKHDFSTFDIFGRFGMNMGAELTSPGWHFADRSKTSAEIILQFYRALRDAVGDAILLGCNTVGHLGAGIFELQRTGDDTSSREWDKTRKMGVNTLAFRLPQHRTFFLADPDCTPLSKSLPLAMSRQWLDLVARSGTVLFISADPVKVTPEEKRLLKAALDTAARIQPEPEPLDWMQTSSPEQWRLGGENAHFTWFGKEGVDFFPK